MKLFIYEDYEVRIAPEALALKPFKKLWDRDKSKNKDKAMAEFGFLYFYCDPRSDFQYIVDDDDRLEAVKEPLGLKGDWKPDVMLKDAIRLYRSFDTPSSILLRAALEGVNKIQKKIKSVDLDEVDDKGKPVVTLDAYLRSLKMVPEVAAMLKEAEKKINEEEQEGVAKGSMEKTLFDDGLEGI